MVKLRLSGLGTAVPPGVLKQSDAAESSPAFCLADARQARILRRLYGITLLQNAGGNGRAQAGQLEPHHGLPLRRRAVTEVWATRGRARLGTVPKTRTAARAIQGRRRPHDTILHTR